MAMSKKKNADRSLSERELDCLIHEAFISSGRLPPQTPDEVPLAMAGFDENLVELPPSLLDALTVLTGRLEPICPKQPPLNPEAVNNLAVAACAARNGGEITSDVRQQMERDRAEAERKSGHADN
jgi:hypothetical protein